MDFVARKIQSEVESLFFKNEAIIIYGARQVGKTTFVKQLMRVRPEPSLYLNCDEPDIREALTDKNSLELQQMNGKLLTFEFKWRGQRSHPPKSFFEVYPDAPVHLVNQYNLLDFLT